MLVIKGIRPLFNHVLLSADVYSDEFVGGIIDPNRVRGSIKEHQHVLAVGDGVRGVSVGDLVCIDPRRYARVEHPEGSMKDGIISHNKVIRYDFPIIEVNGKDCLFLTEGDLRYIVTDSEDVNGRNIMIEGDLKPLIL